MFIGCPCRLCRRSCILSHIPRVRCFAYDIRLLPRFRPHSQDNGWFSEKVKWSAAPVAVSVYVNCGSWRGQCSSWQLCGSCTAFAEPGSFNNPDQKVPLDTHFYVSSDLLTAQGEDRLWISLDFDMTTGDGSGKVRKRESKQERNRGSASVCVVSLYTFVTVNWSEP